MKRVLVAGEGKTELGEWAKDSEYRDAPGERGVLVALIDRFGRDSFTVIDGFPWRTIRKFKAGGHASAEERNVRGLLLSAQRARCDAVVFSRDTDGFVARQRELDAGIQLAARENPNVTIIGGPAVENIEGWILVLLGARDGETIPSKRTQEALEARGVATLADKVAVVDAAPIDALPEGSLKAFLDRARGAFARVEEGS